MIVKHHEEGWEIISHYTHGLLSGKIASKVRKDLMPKNWVDVITGIVEHDDHLPDYDEQNYLTEKGTPKDFTMKGDSNKDALVHAQRVYSNAMQKSQLVALLIGKHLHFLYQSLAEKYKPMSTFLKHVTTQGKMQRKLYGITKTMENNLYQLMLFSDRCSLILCQGLVPEIGRKLEINRTIENKTYFIRSIAEEEMTIEPWPFHDNSFKLDFEYRILNQVNFADNQELKKALEKTEVKLRTLTLSKSG